MKFEIMPDRPTNQQTDGHEGSYGSFTSNDKYFLPKGNPSAPIKNNICK